MRKFFMGRLPGSLGLEALLKPFGGKPLDPQSLVHNVQQHRSIGGVQAIGIEGLLQCPKHGQKIRTWLGKPRSNYCAAHWLGVIHEALPSHQGIAVER
ncbi:hypothetical protein [Acidovorax sp. HMWF029]|uniref:hypothetical protein n=1 Tax=Acidovorax sp. HMWF029 TaxID=2056863 RepID=UPI001304FA7E|nr:hypothetical protein [Acidovorax sp. HMWF029]